MRRLLGLLLAILFLVLPNTVAAQYLPVLDYDNFAPPTDFDLDQIEKALSVVPTAGSCDRKSCPKYSCRAVNDLHLALGKAQGTVERLIENTRLATTAYKELLDRFEADYNRLKITDELLELGKRWSKFSLATGKILLNAASILSGAEAIDQLTALMENSSAEALARALFFIDQMIETHLAVVDIIETVAPLLGGKQVFSDLAGKLFTLRSIGSDVIAALDAYTRALTGYSRALQGGIEYEIKAAKAGLRGLRPTYGSLGQIVGKLLAGYAEIGIAEITDRLAQNAKDEEQDNLAFALNYGRYIRLMDRQVRLSMLLAKLTTALQAIVPCAARCPEWAGYVPPPPTKATTYGGILNELNPTLLGFPDQIRKAAAALAMEQSFPPVLVAVPAVTAPEDRAEARYDLAMCAGTEGAQVRLVYPGFTFRDLGTASAGRDRRMSFRAPVDPDSYLLELRDARGVLLAKAPFTVEKAFPQEDPACGGVTLAKGLAQANGHLVGKSFHFAFGNPGDSDYLAGRIVVTPGISCIGGTNIAFPLFAGASREAEFFQIEMTAGDKSAVRYIEQWILETTIGFDTAASVASSAQLGVEVPPEAKRVDFVKMEVERGPVKTELVWGTP